MAEDSFVPPNHYEALRVYPEKGATPVAIARSHLYLIDDVLLERLSASGELAGAKAVLLSQGARFSEGLMGLEVFRSGYPIVSPDTDQIELLMNFGAAWTATDDRAALEGWCDVDTRNEYYRQTSAHAVTQWWRRRVTEDAVSRAAWDEVKAAISGDSADVFCVRVVESDFEDELVREHDLQLVIAGTTVIVSAWKAWAQ